MKQTRRQFLAAGAVIGTGAVAGCNAVKDAVPFVGGGGVGGYDQWVYVPDKFDGDAESLNFSATSRQAIHENRKEFYPSTYSSLDANYGAIGVNGRDVSMELSLPQGAVLEGSFETSDVTAELEDDANTEYESDGEYEGYQLYAEDEEEPDTAFAVSDSTIVQGQRHEPSFGSDADPVPATDVVEGIIDTKVGEGTRLVDDDDDFATLVDALDAGTSVDGSVRTDAIESDGADKERGRFEDQVASGNAWTVNGDTVSRQWVRVFDSESDVDTGDVEDWIEANDTGGQFTRVRNVEVSQDGRVAVVTGELDTYDLGR